VEWLRRPRVEIVDAPEPSPTAVAAMAFARLGALEDDPDAADTARRIVAAFAGSAPALAPTAGTYFRALRWVLRPPTSVLVVEEALAADEAGPGGDASPAGAGPLLRAALRTYRPETVVRRLRPGDVGSRPHPEPLAAMVTG